jgi:hypothetical protein
MILLNDFNLGKESPDPTLFISVGVEQAPHNKMKVLINCFQLWKGVY